MDTSKDDKLKYYYKRLKEFDKLLTQVKSQTLTELIRKAKTETENSLGKLVEVQKSIIVYLKAYEIQNDERYKEFQTHIDRISIAFKRLKESSVSAPLKSELLDLYKSLVIDLNENLKRREEVRKLTYTVFTSCAKDFEKTLIDRIYKPNTNQFHYETAIDLLNYIGSTLVPFLEEIKTVSNFPVTIRRKQFAKNGDKVVLYLEQYLDILEKWTELANKCIEITK